MTAKKNTRKFRRPKNVEEFITIWGWMDDVVHATKNGKVIRRWEEDCVPRHSSGRRFVTGLDSDGNRTYLTYDNVMAGRYLFTQEFREDMKNFNRVYRAFTDIMNMD